MQLKKTVAILCPILNESESLDIFYGHLSKIINSLNHINFKIVFIDDGSNDDSSTIVKRIFNKDKRIILITLTRNFGKESALTCGFDNIEADAYIPKNASKAYMA